MARTGFQFLRIVICAMVWLVQAAAAQPRPESIGTIAATQQGLIVVSEDGMGRWALQRGVREAWERRASATNAAGFTQLEPVAVSPGGAWLASTRAYTDPAIFIRRAADGQIVRELRAPRAGVDALRFVGSDLLVALYEGKLASAWNVATGAHLGTFDLPESPRLVSASASGRYLAIAQRSERVSVFDLGAGTRLGDFELGRIRWQSGEVMAHAIEFMAFAYDDSIVVQHAPGYIRRFDPRSGDAPTLMARQGLPLRAIATSLSPNGRQLLTADRPGVLTMYLLDQPGSVARQVRSNLGEITASTWQQDSGRYAVADSEGRAEVWTAEGGTGIALEGLHAGRVKHLAFTSDGRFLASAGDDGSVRLRTAADGKDAVRLVGLGATGWLAMTSAGYFHSSSPEAESAINVRIGADVYGIRNFRERYYRPDLVYAALRGNLVASATTLADTRPPPWVQIAPAPATVSEDSHTVIVDLTEQGGGIGDVRVFLNGSAVASLPGQPVAPRGRLRRAIPVKLVPGRNDIEIIAFNAENSLNSKPVQFSIVASKPKRKPILHALIIGIDEFDDQRLKLQYAVKDAEGVERQLLERGRSLYSEVRIQLLTTKAQTSRTALIKALQGYQNIGAEDVFVFYASTHGAVIGQNQPEQEYLLIPSNVGPRFHSGDAISQQELKRLLGSIPAARKLLVLDTCFSGALGEALYQPTVVQGVAEDGAANVLATAIGSTLLAASSPRELSYEGIGGHGFFTWALLQGMAGAADRDKTGRVSTSDLAWFVSREVPRLANAVSRTQTPTTYARGQAFPVVEAR